MLRLILRLNNDDSTTEYEEVFGIKRRFSDLMSHVDEIRNDTSRCEEFAQLCTALIAFVGDSINLPDSSAVFDMFGKMSVNSYSICDAEMQPIGAGVYLGASLLDHSCRPNAVAVFSGTTLQVRCIRPISSAEPVIISYIDQLDTTSERRSQLEHCYYFTCQCESCRDTDDDELAQSTVCPTLNCTGIIRQQADGQFRACTECGRSDFDDSYRSTKLSVTECSLDVLQRAKQLKTDGDAQQLLALCEDCLAEQRNILHRHNILCMKVIDRAFDACIDVGDWEGAIRHGTELNELSRYHYHNFHPNTGVHLMKLGKIQLYVEQFADAEKSLQQAESIIAVTHGSHHVLYRDLQLLMQQCATEQRARHHAMITDEES